MARQRMSMRQLALRLGWTHGMLWRRLAGVTPLTTSDLEEITEALGIPLSALISPRAVA